MMLFKYVWFFRGLSRRQVIKDKILFLKSFVFFLGVSPKRTFKLVRRAFSLRTKTTAVLKNPFKYKKAWDTYGVRVFSLKVELSFLFPIVTPNYKKMARLFDILCNWFLKKNSGVFGFTKTIRKVNS